MVLSEKVATVVSPSVKVNLVYSNKSDEATRNLFDDIQNDAKLRNNLIQEVPQKVLNSVNVLQNITLPERNTYLSESNTLTLLNLEANGISDVFEDNGNLFIVQIVGKNSSEFESFNEFLENRKDKYVELLIGN